MSNKSKCCNAPVEFESDDGFYRCRKCQQPCDVVIEPQSKYADKAGKYNDDPIWKEVFDNVEVNRETTHTEAFLVVPDRLRFDLGSELHRPRGSEAEIAGEGQPNYAIYTRAFDVASESTDAPERITAYYDPATGFAVTLSKELAQAAEVNAGASVAAPAGQKGEEAAFHRGVDAAKEAIRSEVDAGMETRLTAAWNKSDAEFDATVNSESLSNENAHFYAAMFINAIARKCGFDRAATPPSPAPDKGEMVRRTVRRLLLEIIEPYASGKRGFS